MAEKPRASEKRIESFLVKLTEDIGIRLAGSENDRKAIEYVKEQLKQSASDVSTESFDILERKVEEEELEIKVDGKWRKFLSSLFSSTPGTGGHLVEAPLCFFEAPVEYRREDLSYLKGKAVVHLGCHIESRDQYRRLMEAKPAFLLFVDIRYPGATPLADGMFPSYTRALGAVPTLNVAYMDAWNWMKDGATEARICVRGGMAPSTSQNIIAEIPGRDPEAGILFVGGHHDTQAGSPGADDNGVGSAAVVELTRLLAAGGPYRRSLRLISFGAEEQLSVGSAEYVRRHRAELASRGRFMLNFDAFASRMGWFELIVGGPGALTDYLVDFYGSRDIYMNPRTQAVPYADHFPFVAGGVPGAFVSRENCAAGRFFHHRPDDDMSRISVELLTRVIDVSADLLRELAEFETLPFESEIPADQKAAADHFWTDLFGGWEGN